MISENCCPRLIYDFECVAPDGTVRWRERISNLVTTEGRNDLLTKYFKGSTYTAAWYVGLIDNANFTAIAAGDTAGQIDGTNGWDELVAYDNIAVRATLTLGTAGSGSIDNSANKAVFVFSATKTVKGAFVVTTNTRGGTTGVLYSASAFSGTRDVLDNDTLNVQVTLTATAA